MTDRRTLRHAFAIVLLGLAWQGGCPSAKSQELVDPQSQPELVLPTEPVPVGELFDPAVKCPLPEGVTPALSWRIDGKPADAKHLRLSGNGLSGVCSLPEGEHTFTVTGAWGVVEENNQVRITLVDVEGTVTIGKAIPPTPPDPTPVPPGPQPGPIPPLAALVPNRAHRLLLAEWYTDMAAAVRADAYTSTSHFRNGYRLAIDQAQSTGKLPTGISAVDKPISDKIAAAIGLGDVPLDEAKKDALAATLDSVAAEFRW
jgi:hypothetical protein